MPDPVSFTSTTARHKLPMLFAGQAQKEFTVNEGLALLDTLVHPFAEAVLNAPPSAPAAGACWLVGTAPTGAFAGRANALACWDGVQWTFVAAREGMAVRVRGDGRRVFDNAAWQRIAAPAAASGGTTVDQVARDALATVVARLVSAGIFSP